MAVKKVEINYTPEELSEINRIINVITEADTPHEQEVVTKPYVKPPLKAEAETVSHDIEDIDSNMPSDLDLDFEESKPEGKGGPGIAELSDEDLFHEDAREIGDEDIEDITGSISDFETEPGSEPEEILPLSDSDLSFIDEPSEEAKIENEFEDLYAEEIPSEKTKKSPDTFSLETEENFDIPDLDEISLSESAEIQEAEKEDIPDIDLSDLDMPEEKGKDYSETEPADEISDSYADFEEPASAPESSEPAMLDEIEAFSDDFADIDSIPDAFEETAAAKNNVKPEKFSDDFIDENHDEEETLKIEPLDDDIIDHSEHYETPDTDKVRGSSPEMELSSKDMARLKKAIILFNPAVRQAIRETVINDLIPPADMKKLVDMIITGKSEDSIHRFLEKKLKTRIELVDETSPRRRVITSRPEYSLEGRERQKKLLKATGIFGVSMIAAFFITILSYQYVYKPYMAKKLISQGVALIINSSLPGERFNRKNSYDEAERLFREVDEEYIKDYLYGYNEYARAYLSNKDYAESLEKLNKAYTLDKTHIDTLNNLGYFYAKTTNEYFESLKPNIQKWYFADKKEMQGINTALDLSITFYRRALLVDSENIGALVGIGNAYFYQGQYLKAKKYYEDILRVDPDSVAGYSGLLNLYIERDSFPLTATIHAELREKDMLAELPSPLLSKLAGYYLDKRAKGDSNVRIDYGVTSPRLIDSSDNTDPAIMEVLHALNDRDPDYPQLHIQFARFHLARQNLMEMERYLDKALALAPKYYSALHLKGEYYYQTKEPVKAYKYLKEALDNYGSQPEFTREEFYKETENPGKTNMYLGNIFYYFFDKVKSREGALDDEIADNEIEKMENYSFAQKFYTDALNFNYTSSELYYNMGRIHYLKGEYSLALNLWLHLYDDFVKSPELMLSLGNAFYNSGNGAGPGNYEAAKGEYLKLISVMEYEADKIRTVDLSKVSHVKLFQTLSSAYNNLGAVYQNTGEHQKRDLAYWKAIDYGQKMNQENEYARVNLARSNRDAEPLLDKWIPFSIDIYREDMRN
ncbi:MAG TPA: tetratricopeptide repeat protein [Spirochaetota bacterium]|nr:tetratricopeptide repeat protein [Spirochaetota bacterium]HPS86879.1 tetratricopeptide repeat protein [Spirochaetota bacterium]